MKNCTLWTILGLVFLAFAQLAVADENDTNSGALDEVVVTAQKRTERLQDVPISIAALSAADLSRSNVVTASDLPSVVSGLVWSNQGAWVQPNLRGVYTTVAAVGAQAPIAIYLDGVYQPMQAGTITDLADVSRIEVLKGPQGDSLRAKRDRWCHIHLHPRPLIHYNSQSERQRRRVWRRFEPDIRALQRERIRERPAA